jgi:phosphoribosylanthranilate isomerase
MVRVKICGITRGKDARAAVDAGAAALGFIFAPESPRRISPEAVRHILSELPRRVTAVGVVADMERHEILRCIAASGVDALQFHGSETQEDMQGYPGTVFKAVRVRSDATLSSLAAYPGPFLLLDSYVPGRRGGTGQSFDWSLAQQVPPGVNIILAGGLRPDNIAQAVARVRPFAVDVSSGVESEPGVKDPEKIEALFRALRSVAVPDPRPLTETS